MAQRLAVLASGSGTNLQAILDAIEHGQLPAEVVLVASNKSNAPALARVPDQSLALPPEPEETRSHYDARLAAAVAQARPDWVVLAGWMRILTMSFLGQFPNRVINLHPALPGELAGTHAIERAFAEFEAGIRTTSGVMVHLVPDEGVDSGPVLGTTDVKILPDDSLATFEARVHAAEHELLVATLAKLCITEETPQ
jgi:formyltetrahydrofolate-dependent phosphoribosylglycinamide formyltransferase